jgi:uncharacterized protein YpmB
MILQGLHVILLALTPMERWGAARSSFSSGSQSEWLLTLFAVVALLVSLILLFWVSIKHGRSKRELNEKITDLTIANVQLRQENDEQIAANTELQQAIVGLSRKQVEVLKNITDAANAKEVKLSAGPSRN